MNYIKALYSKGLQSSTSPGVIIKLRSSPFSLQNKCNLKPKSQPIEPELGYIASSFVREDIFWSRCVAKCFYGAIFSKCRHKNSESQLLKNEMLREACFFFIIG